MVQRRSNFDFVHDDVLQENLDRVFDHIIELVSLAESSAYNPILQSSFRKTVIIYTGSIIEALLLYVLKEHKTEKECAKSFVEFKIMKDIYQIDESKKIVLGEDRKKSEKLRFDKINLDQINNLCKEHNFISADLHKKVDKVRKLRNRQHLGGLEGIDWDYRPADLKFVFLVMDEIKELTNEG